MALDISTELDRRHPLLYIGADRTPPCTYELAPRLVLLAAIGLVLALLDAPLSGVRDAGRGVEGKKERRRNGGKKERGGQQQPWPNPNRI